MATEHILTRGHDRIRVVHDVCDLITGEGDNAIIQSFDDEAAARSHLDYVLMRRRRDGYALSSRDVVSPSLADSAADDALFEWEPSHRRLKCVFEDEAGVRARCDALVTAASTREAASLHFVCDLASPGRALSDALERRPLPSVRRLIFDTPFQTITRQRDNSPGRLDVVLTALPGLEHAYVTGAAELQRVGHTRLRSLHLLGDPFPAASLAGLGDSDLPALERLVLCLSRDDEDPVGAAEVAGALHRLRAPALCHLDVSGSDDLPGLLDALCSRPLPARWATVSLDGILHDEDELLDVLAERAEVLGRLGHLALRLHDLSEEAAARAVQLVPRLVDREDLPDLLLPSVYEEW